MKEYKRPPIDIVTFKAETTMSFNTSSVNTANIINSNAVNHINVSQLTK